MMPETSLQDYWNEPWGLISGISNELYRKIGKELRRNDNITDEEFLNALSVVRKTYKLRTVEERFFLPDSPQIYREPEQSVFVEWANNNPERIARINQLTQKLNTTMDMLEFKRTINEIGKAIYGESRKPEFDVPALVGAPRNQSKDSPKP